MDIGNPSARSPAYVAARTTLVETSGTTADPRTREVASRFLADSVARTAKVEPVDDERRERDHERPEREEPARPARSSVASRLRDLFGSLKEFPHDVNIVVTMRELAARALREVTGGPEIRPAEEEAGAASPTDEELEHMLRESEDLDDHTSFLGKLRTLALDASEKDQPDSGFLLDVTG